VRRKANSGEKQNLKNRVARGKKSVEGAEGFKQKKQRTSESDKTEPRIANQGRKRGTASSKHWGR